MDFAKWKKYKKVNFFVILVQLKTNTAKENMFTQVEIYKNFNRCLMNCGEINVQKFLLCNHICLSFVVSIEFSPVLKTENHKPIANLCSASKIF